MRKPRIIHITRQVAAWAAAVLSAASTINGYRPLARNGYPSLCGRDNLIWPREGGLKWPHL